MLLVDSEVLQWAWMHFKQAKTRFVVLKKEKVKYTGSGLKS